MTMFDGDLPDDPKDKRIRALEADRDQISLTLDVAKADRDKWFNRARALEAALRTLWQNQDHDTWAPDFVAEVRALLKGSTPETACEHSMEKMVTTNAGTVHVCEQCSGTRFVSYESDRGAAK